MTAQPGHIGAKHFSLRTADDLIARLDPRHRFWESLASEWIYRGHADADWRLLPSVLRTIHRTHWLRDEFVTTRNASSEWTQASDFMWRADRAGLLIPPDWQSAPERTISPTDGLRMAPAEWAAFYADWPDTWAWTGLALAQHSGMPTRLLDWSYRPLVAALFAARDALTRVRAGTQSSDSLLCVWALHTQVPQFVEHFRVRPDIDPVMHLVKTSFAMNRNQHAQMGVFTLMRRVPNDTPELHEVDRFVSSVATRFDFHFSQDAVGLAKFTLPVARAPKLLSILESLFVSAATVFPGYRGAAMAALDYGLQHTRFPRRKRTS